jgi:hypothetical protein
MPGAFDVVSVLSSVKLADSILIHEPVVVPREYDVVMTSAFVVPKYCTVHALSTGIIDRYRWKCSSLLKATCTTGTVGGRLE